MGSTTEPYSKQYYGLTTMNGYKFGVRILHTKSTILGDIGAGMLFYNESPLFPLYLDIRFTMNNKRISPFIFRDCGILLNAGDI
jgi:hypothetical protein